MYMIYKDDYIRHIDDKVILYGMLRQLEAAIEKLPKCSANDDVRSCTEAYSARLNEMWAAWNIPARYLVSGDENDLSALLADELIEPEDAGYFCAESYVFPVQKDDPAYNNELAGTARKYLLEALRKAVRFAQAAANNASELMTECREFNNIINASEEREAQ